MLMHVLVVKNVEDDYEWVDYMLESFAVEGNYRRDDGFTWDDLVAQAENKYGADNVRVVQVDMEADCKKDVVAYNIELHNKLHREDPIGLKA